MHVCMYVCMYLLTSSSTSSVKPVTSFGASTFSAASTLSTLGSSDVANTNESADDKESDNIEDDLVDVNKLKIPDVVVNKVAEEGIMYMYTIFYYKVKDLIVLKSFVYYVLRITAFKLAVNTTVPVLEQDRVIIKNVEHEMVEHSSASSLATASTSTTTDPISQKRQSKRKRSTDLATETHKRSKKLSSVEKLEIDEFGSSNGFR